MAETSAVSAQGIIATFNSVVIGRVTNIALDYGVIDLDDTDLSHTRENHQSGIETVSGSIDCLGDPADIISTAGALVLSGTSTEDYGECICLGVGLGASVKGQRTARYTFASSVAAS